MNNYLLPEIVILDAYVANPGDYSWDPLQEFGNLTVWQRSFGREEILSRARNAQILLVDKIELSADMLENLPKLEMISVLATGYNIIDMQAATERGILVCNVPSYSTDSVAQHVFAMLLQLMNHSYSYTQAVAAGEWCSSTDFTIFLEPIRELAGLTMGIVGFGAIGTAVAKIAQAFGMKVIANNRSEKSYPGVEFVDLQTLLAESDVISLHCPLTADNAKMINQETLALMKKSACLINTARGALIDEKALAQALNEEEIAAAILDVLSEEPPTTANPLLKAKNCLITPHVAWAGVQARKELMQVTFKNIQQYLQGKPQNLVNPEALKNKKL